MDAAIKSLCDAIRDLAAHIKVTVPVADPLIVHYGWNAPSLTKDEIANIGERLANRIESLDLKNLDTGTLNETNLLINRIAHFKNTVGNLPGGNAYMVTPNYILLIEAIRSLFDPNFGWSKMTKKDQLPADLLLRIRTSQRELDEVDKEKSSFENKINQINLAYSNAVSLPTHLENFEEAKFQIENFQKESEQLYDLINDLHKGAVEIKNALENKRNDAEKIVQQCEEAYKISTTTGLAGAFDDRAKKLRDSTNWWVSGLIGTLLVAIFVGYVRFENLNETIKKASEAGSSNDNGSSLWIEIIMSVLGLGAPIWFAWVSTKQILQRFRLSEDYAFKASVAKAYEGYRKEAARIDKNLEAKLLQSALDRLEEAPLRVLDKKIPETPYQDLLNSSSFKLALRTIPDFKDQITEFVKSALSKKS